MNMTRFPAGNIDQGVYNISQRKKRFVDIPGFFQSQTSRGG
jgi:hypothetical protein